MRVRSSWQMAAVMFCLLVTLATAAAGDSRADYDRYVAAYQAYQNAVTQNAPEAEVQKRLADFRQAKAAYEQAFQTQKPADNASDEPQDPSLAAPQPGETDPYEAPLEQTGATVKRQPALPAELQGILKSLWNTNTEKPDAAMAQLKQYIARHPNTREAAIAKYELAKAFEILKNDPARSGQLLKELARDPHAGNLAQVAADRLRFHQAEGQRRQWKQVLEQKNQAVAQSYDKYLNTSWLAFPVKLARWTGYAGKLISFNGAQKDFEKFQISFEEFAARFTPPVGVVFDAFKTPTGKANQQTTVALQYQNNKSWYSRWKLLNDARSSIYVQYFIIEKDIFGMALQGVLLRKAREGVKIHLMMDARGTKEFTRKLVGQDFLQELCEYPNVEVRVFNPVHRNLATLLFDFRKIMSSNHDKIIVVDDEYSVIGGRNVSMNYFVDPEDEPTVYRDCDVIIHSPAIADQLVFAFSEEFAKLKSNPVLKDLFGNIDVMSREMETAWQAMDSYIRGGEFFRAPDNAHKAVKSSLKDYNKELAGYKNMIHYAGFDPFAKAHECPVKIIDKHSLQGFRNDITDQLIRFIDGARSEIIIQNPYVVLTDRAFNALVRASRRGVKIYIHTNSPASTDSLATQAMFYGDWKRILKEIPTCRIFTYYQARKLHAKNFLFDNSISIIGTYNMDSLSEQVNSEVIAAIKSPAFARELRAEMMNDIRASKEYKIEVQPDGSVKAVFGPDDLPGKNMWLMKALSTFKFLKPII